MSINYVNSSGDGFVDFEKFFGLDGIVVVNTVSNVDAILISGHKELQTGITHNDGTHVCYTVLLLTCTIVGGTWKPLKPPPSDSKGQNYECDSTIYFFVLRASLILILAGCTLHIHGYTERYDARATYSSPSVVGRMMAVGSVGTKLAPYTESDTYLSRDVGFNWEEVHKDARRSNPQAIIAVDPNAPPSPPFSYCPVVNTMPSMRRILLSVRVLTCRPFKNIFKLCW